MKNQNKKLIASAIAVICSGGFSVATAAVPEAGWDAPVLGFDPDNVTTADIINFFNNNCPTGVCGSGTDYEAKSISNVTSTEIVFNASNNQNFDNDIDQPFAKVWVYDYDAEFTPTVQIGRASCRERV